MVKSFLEKPKSLFYLWLLTVVTILLPAFTIAQELTLDVSPREGSVDDTFIFTVYIDGGSLKGGFPYLVGGDDFKLTLIGPRSSVLEINGVTRRRVAYTYRLVPKNPGTLETPGAEIDVGGRKLRAPPLKVEVKQSSLPRVGADGEIELAFVTQTVSASRPFVGEQLIGSIELFTAIRLEDMRYSNLSYDGFWSEPIPGNETSERMIGNRHYNVWKLRKAIYALAAGTVVIPPRELKARALLPGRRFAPPRGRIDPLDPRYLDRFIIGGVTKDIVLRSNSLTVEVQPLPERPRNFPDWGTSNVLVGPTNLEVRYSPEAIAVGQSKSVEIRLTSFGNVSAFKAPPVPTSPEYRIYEDIPKVETHDDGGKIISSKIFKISLVPLSGNEVRIPQLKLGYFDPESKGYIVLEAKEIRFPVVGGAPKVDTPVPSASPTVAAQESETEPETLRPAYAYEEETSSQRFLRLLSPSLSLLVLMSAATGLAVAALLFGHRRRAGPASSVFKELRNARSVEQLDGLFRRYLALRLTGKSEIPNSQQLKEIIQKSVDDADRRFNIQLLLDKLELTLFGGKNVDERTLADLRSEAEVLARLI